MRAINDSHHIAFLANVNQLVDWHHQSWLTGDVICQQQRRQIETHECFEAVFVKENAIKDKVGWITNKEKHRTQRSAKRKWILFPIFRIYQSRVCWCTMCWLLSKKYPFHKQTLFQMSVIPGPYNAHILKGSIDRNNCRCSCFCPS